MKGQEKSVSTLVTSIKLAEETGAKYMETEKGRKRKRQEASETNLKNKHH